MTASLDDIVFAAVASIRRHSPHEITPDAQLADLGHDSLDRITLATTLERTTGVPIDDVVLPVWRTVGDILNYLHATSPNGRTA